MSLLLRGRQSRPEQVASVLCLECGARVVVDEPKPGTSMTCRACDTELVVGVLRVDRVRRRSHRVPRSCRPSLKGLRERAWTVVLLLFVLAIAVVVAAYPVHAQTTYAWLQQQLADQISQHW